MELGVDAATKVTATTSDLANYNNMDERAEGSGSRTRTILDPLNPGTFQQRLCISVLEQIDDVTKYYDSNFHVLADKHGSCCRCKWFC